MAFGSLQCRASLFCIITNVSVCTYTSVRIPAKHIFKQIDGVVINSNCKMVQMLLNKNVMYYKDGQEHV
jgi:hypothetical protein